MNMKEKAAQMSTDEILETLAWIVDRLRYCAACGKRSSGEDAIFESVLLSELDRRTKTA